MPDPATARRRLEIVPAGGVSQSFLATLGRELDARLGTAHHVAAPLDVPGEPTREIDSATLLDALVERAGTGGDEWLLAVTDLPLRAPRVGRVFGEAAVGGGCAVVGLADLDGGSGCGETTLLDRAVKEGVHELGHAAGLAHCADPLCVMYPSLHIADTDRKAGSFCARCRGDFRNATLDAARG